MSIFENLENLKVSESCFNEIMDIVEALLDEGIMDDIKGGMSPEKAKEKWVKDKNKEYVEANRNTVKAERLYNKAFKKFKDKAVDWDVVSALGKDVTKAREIERAKFNTQLNANYDTKAGKHKMVLPVISRNGKNAYQSGYEKGGKKFTPKK